MSIQCTLIYTFIGGYLALIKKLNTPICGSRSAGEERGTGPESNRFKSQLIVPLIWEGEGGGSWSFRGGLHLSICLWDVIQGPRGSKEAYDLAFWPSKEILLFCFILIANLITDERMEHKQKRGETSVQDTSPTSAPNPILNEKAKITKHDGNCLNLKGMIIQV